jgi:hypothetical protein
MQSLSTLPAQLAVTRRLSDPSLVRDLKIRDVRHCERVIPVRRGGSIRGYEPFREGHPSVAFESLIERACIRHFARLPQCLSITAQPVTVYYSLAGKTRHYTPDFRVDLVDAPSHVLGRTVAGSFYVECKPENLVSSNLVSLRPGFAAVQCALNRPIYLITDAMLARVRPETRHEH